MLTLTVGSAELGATTDVTVCWRSGGSARVMVWNFSDVGLRCMSGAGRQQHRRSARPARRRLRSRLSTAGKTSSMVPRWNSDKMADWREKMRSAGMGINAAARKVSTLLREDKSIPSPVFFSSTPICSCTHKNNFEYITKQMASQIAIYLLSCFVDFNYFVNYCCVHNLF